MNEWASDRMSERTGSMSRPLASSLNLCTDSRRFSFSSSSLSRKAFLSMAWFRRCSKFSRETMVALWGRGHSKNPTRSEEKCHADGTAPSKCLQTSWLVPGHRWTVPVLARICEAAPWCCVSAPGHPPEQRSACNSGSTAAPAFPVTAHKNISLGPKVAIYSQPFAKKEWKDPKVITNLSEWGKEGKYVWAKGGRRQGFVHKKQVRVMTWPISGSAFHL